MVDEVYVMVFMRYKRPICPADCDVVWKGKNSMIAMTSLFRYHELRKMILNKITLTLTEIQLIKKR